MRAVVEQRREARTCLLLTHTTIPRLLAPCAAAPEVCAGQAYRGRQADMWALGVSLYLFIYGQLPFQVGMPARAGTAVPLCASGWRRPPAASPTLLAGTAPPSSSSPLFSQGEGVLDLYDAIAQQEVRRRRRPTGAVALPHPALPTQSRRAVIA